MILTIVLAKKGKTKKQLLHKNRSSYIYGKTQIL